jgi:hypothetical protein
MPDFGQCGTRTVTIYHGDVTVAGLNGQYLEYVIDAQGGNPLFVYSCAHRDLIVASYQFAGHPLAQYAWHLVLNAAAVNSPTDFTADSLPTDAFVVSVSFLGATDYKLNVNLRDPGGTLKQIVQQIEYKSQVAQDSFREGLMVTWS